MNILKKFGKKLKRLLKKMCDAYLEYYQEYGGLEYYLVYDEFGYYQGYSAYLKRREVKKSG